MKERNCDPFSKFDIDYILTCLGQTPWRRKLRSLFVLVLARKLDIKL
jgi:hypothetical protein